MQRHEQLYNILLSKLKLTVTSMAVFNATLELIKSNRGNDKNMKLKDMVRHATRTAVTDPIACDCWASSVEKRWPGTFSTLKKCYDAYSLHVHTSTSNSLRHVSSFELTSKCYEFFLLFARINHTMFDPDVNLAEVFNNMTTVWYDVIVSFIEIDTALLNDDVVPDNISVRSDYSLAAQQQGENGKLSEPDEVDDIGNSDYISTESNVPSQLDCDDGDHNLCVKIE